MGFRITTWNVNGIRNPFSYEPWRGTKTFESMFDILEADIVVFQETKIQRKDLRDDMVLVPGWDCFFSLPTTKKGYSGVVIYTRNATCAPILAEEGLTGILCPPNSSTSFRDLPDRRQIGGYPTTEQLSQIELDAATLDSEGRCVVLEFPGFVLLGIYSPANRDTNRDLFRHSFLDLLDARIRNLVAMGKRVVVTGDLNISREEIDAAHAAEAIRKGSTTEDEFISAPARRLLNQLVIGGKVWGERDWGRENPILHDICRAFHPDRRGMYTCWEQRINARPGNYGSRIDYVLCSRNMQTWFSESNIQEGLMGSDHCPVYAVFKDFVPLGGESIHIHDLVNPPGMFHNGERQQEYSAKFLLPLSGRLIPEFDKRRSIKDMFTRNSSISSQKSTPAPTSQREKEVLTTTGDTSFNGTADVHSLSTAKDVSSSKGTVRKRSEKSDPPQSIPLKRSKSNATPTPPTSTPGQKSLKGFFKAKAPAPDPPPYNLTEIPSNSNLAGQTPSPLKPTPTPNPAPSSTTNASTSQDNNTPPISSQDSDTVHDPIASKEDWSKLFTKKPAPKCDSHQEPCISLSTKKPGVNCGRSFWICPRPLGPSGNKEKGTEWRCSTFVWASDWNP